MSSKEIIVSLALRDQNICVGKLWCHTHKNKESASFEYDHQWLTHPEKFALEPALQLTAGTFHSKTGLRLFGAFGDSAPDRWGRILMRRATIAEAKAKHTTPATLAEIDYLLGVNDEARQGALRFSLATEKNTWLAPKNKAAIPPLLQLPKLLAATERFIADNENTSDLKLLLAPGSSLGGARPKASVRDQDGTLAIAKFPKKDDELNVVLWEAVALTLASKAGINVPDWHLTTILHKPVLVIKRFDRSGNQRIPFLSAMSMLNAQDNEQHSYLEIAYALAQYSGTPTADMEALWRRIIFTIMIANTDDHLRNHGFIYQRHTGWQLSPAYDLNPTPTHIKPRVLTTAIDFDDTSASLETAMSVIKEFRVSTQRAKEIINETKQAVKQWRNVASQLGISKSECDEMSSAFDTETN